jgi:hypothetical protein
MLICGVTMILNITAGAIVCEKRQFHDCLFQFELDIIAASHWLWRSTFKRKLHDFDLYLAWTDVYKSHSLRSGWKFELTNDKKIRTEGVPNKNELLGESLWSYSVNNGQIHKQFVGLGLEYYFFHGQT